jgi:hypothetical protein
MKYIDIQTISPNTYLVWVCHDGAKTAVMQYLTEKKIIKNP